MAEAKYIGGQRICDLTARERIDTLSVVVLDRTIPGSTTEEYPVSIPNKYVGEMRYTMKNLGTGRGYFQIFFRDADGALLWNVSQPIDAGGTLSGAVEITASKDVAKIIIKTVNGHSGSFCIETSYLDALIDSSVISTRNITIGAGLESIEENYGYGNTIKIHATNTSTRIFESNPKYSSEEFRDIFADATVTEVPHNKYVYADLSTGKLYLSDNLITNDLSKILLFQNYLGIMQKGFSAYLRAKTITNLAGDVNGIAAELEDLKAYGYKYTGERIHIAPQLKYEKIAQFTRGYVQGAACYGNLIFQFHSQNQVEDGNFHGCSIYDLSAGRVIQYIELGYNELIHNNNASFGKLKYDSADPFPLLYASQEHASARNILVYRITETGQTATPYRLTLVQTITMPPASEWPVVYPNACVGNDGYLYTLGWRSSETKYELVKYTMPTGNATLSYADRIESVDCPVLTNEQGFMVYDSKLYFLCGSSSNSNMQVISLHNGYVLSSVNFNDCDLPYEPEGVFLHDGKLCVSFAGYGVAKFTF